MALFHLKKYHFELSNSEPTTLYWAFFNVTTGIVYNSYLKLLINSIFSDRKIYQLYKMNIFNLKFSLKPLVLIEHGPWDNYYHWYVDSIPRLFWLWQGNNKLRGSVFLLCSKKLSKEEEAILLALLPTNVRLKYVQKNQCYLASKFIYLPFLSGNNSACLPTVYLDFFKKKIINLLELKKTSDFKIFISREKSLKRKFINQNEVNEWFYKEGFLILCLEDLTIKEQANYFYSANLIVAQHGAGLTNLLYSEKSSVIEIFSCLNINHNHYKDLCQMNNIKYYSYSCSGENKNSDVFLDLLNFKKSFKFLLSNYN